MFFQSFDSLLTVRLLPVVAVLLHCRPTQARMALRKRNKAMLNTFNYRDEDDNVMPKELMSENHHYNDGQDNRQLYPGRPLRAEFNTLPAGGWSNHTILSGGLEWLYAGPAAPTPNYFETYPAHYQCEKLATGPYKGGIVSNFPDCVRFSGFRLPIYDELTNLRPKDPPECMVAYTSSRSSCRAESGRPFLSRPSNGRYLSPL